MILPWWNLASAFLSRIWNTIWIYFSKTEKQSLKAQYESLQRECSLTSDHQNHLVSRNHDIEKENLTLKNRMEEVSHKSKLEVTNIKMEMLRERGELERERDRLRNQIEGE